MSRRRDPERHREPARLDIRRDAREQVVAVVAVDDEVADAGEAPGLCDAGDQAGEPFRGDGTELPCGETAEERPLAGEACRVLGVAGLPAVAAELRVVVGGGALLVGRGAGPPGSGRPGCAG